MEGKVLDRMGFGWELAWKDWCKGGKSDPPSSPPPLENCLGRSLDILHSNTTVSVNCSLTVSEN